MRPLLHHSHGLTLRLTTSDHSARSGATVSWLFSKKPSATVAIGEQHFLSMLFRDGWRTRSSQGCVAAAWLEMGWTALYRIASAQESPLRLCSRHNHHSGI